MEGDGSILLDLKSRALFAGPNFAHVATVLRDGTPHTVPVWVDVEGDERVLVSKEESSVACRNLRRDPRVAMSIVNVANPCEYAAARGRVVEVRGGPEALRWVRQLAVKYTGEPYPEPMSGPLAVFVVELERLVHHEITSVVHAPPSGG